MIQYYVRKNNLNTSDEVPYLPKTVVNESVDLEQMIKEISRGTTVMPADTKAVLENLSDVTLNNIQRGRAVNLGFAIIKPVIKGAFDAPDEQFTSGKHKIDVSVSASQSFKKKAALGTSVLRIDKTASIPLLFGISNFSSPHSETFKSGDLVKITGNNLFFDAEDASLGIFLTNGSTDVKVIEYGEIRNKSILFKIPAEAIAGEDYLLEVRALFGKNIRKGRLEEEISIVS